MPDLPCPIPVCGRKAARADILLRLCVLFSCVCGRQAARADILLRLKAQEHARAAGGCFPTVPAPDAGTALPAARPRLELWESAAGGGGREVLWAHVV